MHTLHKLLIPFTLINLFICLLSCKKSSDSSSKEPLTEPVFTISTFAGTGDYGSVDGPLSNCTFAYPHGITKDTHGFLYVVDEGTTKIRKISPQGFVSTINLSGALLYNPGSIAVDSSGNMFVSCWRNQIFKITPDGQTTLYAGNGKRGDTNGPALEASFYSPNGLACDANGNVYVADWGNSQIRKISPDGIVSKVPGTGIINEPDRSYVNFLSPTCVALDKHGNIYVGHESGISKIDASAKVTSVANTGGGVTSMVMDEKGNFYVTILTKSLVKKITTTGKVIHMAGTGKTGYLDGEGINAQLYWPQGITISKDGKSLLIADATNYRIRKIEL